MSKLTEHFTATLQKSPAKGGHTYVVMDGSALLSLRSSQPLGRRWPGSLP